MDLYPDSLVMANWTITTDVTLASATAEVYLAGAWRTLTWTAAQTGGGPYTRVGQILVSGTNPATGVKPTAADSIPLVRVSVGGEVVESGSSTRINLRT